MSSVQSEIPLTHDGQQHIVVTASEKALYVYVQSFLWENDEWVPDDLKNLRNEHGNDWPISSKEMDALVEGWRDFDPTFRGHFWIPVNADKSMFWRLSCDAEDVYLVLENLWKPKQRPQWVVHQRLFPLLKNLIEGARDLMDSLPQLLTTETAEPEHPPQTTTLLRDRIHIAF